jgi:hypothetical protein
MPRALPHLVGLVCFSILLGVCYHSVLFEDGQFAYGDTAFFYYPLYQRVQQEWDAGRCPLWDAGQNGGMPLLGNPTAAVLYPGKVLFILLPYPWAFRLYVIGHTIVAFLGALALGRSCGVSWVGAYLGGLSYAFGSPVLSQYCNVIFLVGAAWTPWGLSAIDRLLRQRRRRGAVELAVILALEVLGGDPEAAYLTAVCGAGYAAVLMARGRIRPRWLRIGPTILGAVGICVVATLGLARAAIVPPRPTTIGGMAVAAWLALGLVLAGRWYRRPGEARLAPMLAGLVGACILAISLAAAQVLPTLEFFGQTWRASGIDATEVYRNSLDPWRLVELVWPNVFGTDGPENRSWLQAIPPAGDHEVWAASLYMGGPALVLALAAARCRSDPPWRAWLTTVAAVALLASFGRYASPLWWARWGPWSGDLGLHEIGHGQPRPDHRLHDGAGSPYGLLTIILPGFAGFRYPGKLTTFTAVGLVVLAGAGWDQVARGQTRRLWRLVLAGLGTSLVGLGLTVAARDRALASLTGRVSIDPIFGPADIAGAWAQTQRALAHGAVVFAAVLTLARWAPRRPQPAGAIALILLTADLAVANARLVWTAPQADFETPSAAAQRIEAAEHRDRSPGPFRIHRFRGWFPIRFRATGSPQRVRELTSWCFETLQHLVALPLRLDYGTSFGSFEIEDYVSLFHPTARRLPEDIARMLGVATEQPVTYFPRRSFDLWGTRYFILPASPDWASPTRGFVSFLDQTELIYPSPDVLHEEPTPGRGEPWAVSHDWQLRRNKAAYPRAWLVHSARVRSPARDPGARAEMIRDLVFMNDPIWRDRDRPILDLRQTALIEVDDKESLKGVLSPTPVGPSESVAVVEHGPQRVVLRAALERPGLVILADAYYPGWHLTIDGESAPIYRANRMMRGAAVPRGHHTLVYTYRPASFLIGATISVAGLCTWMVFAWWSRRERLTLSSAPESSSEPVAG